MRNKKLHVRKNILVSALLCILLFCMSYPVFADEAGLTLPVTQKITVSGKGSSQSDADAVAVTYKLTAQNDAPMPQDAENGEYRFTLTGTDDACNLIITYAQTGEYHYTLEMESFSGVEEQDLSANLRSVEIVVSVTRKNGELYRGIYVYVKEAASDEGKKMSEIVFDYSLKKENTKTPAESGDSTPEVPKEPEEPTPVPPTMEPTPVIPAKPVDSRPVTSTETTSATPAAPDTTGSRTDRTAVVKTGDETILVPYFVAMGAAVAGIVVIVIVLVVKRRKENTCNGKNVK